MQVWDLHLRSRLTTNPEKFQLTIRTMGVRRMMVWILLQAFRPDHQPGRGVSNSQEQISSRKPISQTTSTEPNTAILADASCQTWDQSAVDIELQESSARRMSKIFYTKVYVKKHMKREGMEIEKEKKAHHPKSEKKISREPQKFYKVSFCA